MNVDSLKHWHILIYLSLPIEEFPIYLLDPIFLYQSWLKKLPLSHRLSFPIHKIPVNFSQRVRAMTTNLPEAGEEERTAQVRMEESFTIILGNSIHV